MDWTDEIIVQLYSAAVLWNIFSGIYTIAPPPTPPPPEIPNRAKPDTLSYLRLGN